MKKTKAQQTKEKIQEKKVNLEFFQIRPTNVRDNILSGYDISKAIRELPDKDMIEISMGDRAFVLIEQCREQQGFIVGALAVAQMENISPLLNIKTKEIIEALVKSNEGPMKSTCFVIDPKTNILVIDKYDSSGAPPASSVGRYLSMVSNLSGQIDVNILLSPDDEKKLSRINRLAKFRVKVVRAQNGTVFSDYPDAIAPIIRVADQTRNDDLIVELNASKDNDNTLNVPKIVEWVRSFLRFKDTDEVVELKLDAELDDSDKFSILDLIKNKIKETYTIEIKKEKTVKEIYVNERIEKIIEVYNSKKLFLNAAYKV